MFQWANRVVKTADFQVESSFDWNAEYAVVVLDQFEVVTLASHRGPKLYTSIVENGASSVGVRIH